MMHGERVTLRARTEQDVPILHAELYEDVPGYLRAYCRAWQPIAAGAHSPYAPSQPSDTGAVFSVLERSTGELAGEANLWGIDMHNRTAHLGVGLRPSMRGKGLGSDVVRVLCEYGFAVRGLQRLGIETLADNLAMRAAAVKNGFTLEGTLRRTVWINGDFVDEEIYGLLAREWSGS